MLKRILILLVLSLMFMACKDNVLNLKIRYHQVQGLKQGDRVVFEQNHIGEVNKVLYSEEDFFIVYIVIKKEFANVGTEHSRFFIITDPQNTENKAVEMIHINKGGILLHNNATLEGSTEASVFINKLFNGIENGLEDLQKQFDQFSKDLKNIPESEEFKRLEKELKHLAKEMKRSGEATRQKLQKELLPKLKEEMEKLRERLREFGHEDEIKPLEIQMQKMQKI